jgi:RHS repeat-associated protein
VAQVVAGAVTRFLLDTNRPLARLIEEYTPNGVIQTAYVYGLSLLLQNRGGVRSFYHVDALGSVRALTDASGSITDRYVYDVFGQIISQTGSTDNRYLFAGEEREPILRLDYLRARHYDPALGRFTSTDPLNGSIAVPQSLHPYSYSDNDPVNKVDPSGKDTLGLVSDFLELLTAIPGAPQVSVLKKRIRSSLVSNVVRERARVLWQLTLADPDQVEYCGAVGRSGEGLIINEMRGEQPTPEQPRHGVLGTCDIHKVVAALPGGYDLVALYHTHPPDRLKVGGGPGYDPFSPSDHDNTQYYRVNHYVVEADGQWWVDEYNEFGGGTFVSWQGHV